VIGELAAKGYQVFLTTHSPEMLSFDNKQKIVRFIRSEAGVSSYEYTNSSSSKTLAQEQKLRSKGNHELIFSNKVILTEGENDQLAVRIGLEKIGFDVDSESVSVIDCGSVDNLPDYAEVSSKLGIPWFAVHDNDIQTNGSRKPNTERAISKLSVTQKNTDLVSKWDNELEDVLGISGKAKVEQVASTLEPLSWEAISTDPRFTKYSSVINEVHAWLS
jgi:predicted ATP-dependent endonuclease of OLD family